VYFQLSDGNTQVSMDTQHEGGTRRIQTYKIVSQKLESIRVRFDVSIKTQDIEASPASSEPGESFAQAPQARKLHVITYRFNFTAVEELVSKPLSDVRRAFTVYPTLPVELRLIRN
jgi:hypothetical protein